ncbi:MAG: HAMP domain-containing protein, partial [Christensenellaceae bacterium]|nr:HAMP domain-containing protein [Christensenellaceae bacterium]
MKRSVLFARVFGVAILTILMTALFTTFAFTYVAGSVFQNIKETELLPRARPLGDLIMLYGDRLDDPDALNLLGHAVGERGSGNLLLGAYVVATDARGNVLLHSHGMPEEYLNAMVRSAADVLAEGELRTAQIKALRGTGMVCVGVPLTVRGERVGAVLLMMPLYEAMVAMGSLSGALALSLFLSLPLVTILVSWVVGRIVQPLKQMRDVAVGMASGNFEARADDSQRGEIGQLGRSLNHLSRELKRTISALTLERNRLQQALDGLREGIVAVDLDGRVTHSNPAVVRLF